MVICIIIKFRQHLVPICVCTGLCVIIKFFMAFTSNEQNWKLLNAYQFLQPSKGQVIQRASNCTTVPHQDLYNLFPIVKGTNSVSNNVKALCLEKSCPLDFKGSENIDPMWFPHPSQAQCDIF